MIATAWSADGRQRKSRDRHRGKAAKGSERKTLLHAHVSTPRPRKTSARCECVMVCQVGFDGLLASYLKAVSRPWTGQGEAVKRPWKAKERQWKVKERQ